MRQGQGHVCQNAERKLQTEDCFGWVYIPMHNEEFQKEHQPLCPGLTSRPRNPRAEQGKNHWRCKTDLPRWVKGSVSQERNKILLFQCSYINCELIHKKPPKDGVYCIWIHSTPKGILLLLFFNPMLICRSHMQSTHEERWFWEEKIGIFMGGEMVYKKDQV